MKPILPVSFIMFLQWSGINWHNAFEYQDTSYNRLIPNAIIKEDESEASRALSVQKYV